MAVTKNTIEKQSNVTENGKVAFAKLLAGNDKKIRDKGLKKLTRWLSARSAGNYAFTENDLMTIWVGLFYSMWMSDLPLVQEDLAEALSSLIHCFNKNYEAALLFIQCFNKTMNNTWSTLDQHRIDKFSMFVRRFLRQSLVWLSNREWAEEEIHNLMDVYKNTVLSEKAALGFKLQFIEVFAEELAKVGNGKLKPKAVVIFCTPFAYAAATTRDGRVRMELEKFFRNLLKQTDLGLDYEEKYAAWKKAGCPEGDVNAMQLVVDDDEEPNEQDDAEEESEDLDIKGPLDPRAGSVHVTLPQIQLPALKLAKMAQNLIKLPNATLKGKRMMINLKRKLRKLNKGKYPYEMKKIGNDDPVRLRTIVRDAIKKSVKKELKQSKKRALMKKKLKMLKKKNNQKIETVEIKPTLVTGEKRKRRDSADDNVVVKKKKIGFDVSDVSEAGVLPNGNQNAESWIVEDNDSIPEAPQPAEKPTIEKEKSEKNDSAVAVPIVKRRPCAELAAADSTVEIDLSVGNKELAKPNIWQQQIESPLDRQQNLKDGRRISFNLLRNMAQEKDEYLEQLQQSPQIPFDAKKLPKQSALKAGLPPSPINPFYERLLKMKK